MTSLASARQGGMSQSHRNRVGPSTASKLTVPSTCMYDDRTELCSLHGRSLLEDLVRQVAPGARAFRLHDEAAPTPTGPSLTFSARTCQARR